VYDFVNLHAVQNGKGKQKMSSVIIAGMKARKSSKLIN
jgi:hypothetical protein